MTFFPFPFVINRNINDGVLFKIPSICRKCNSNECVGNSEVGEHLCSFGYNYYTVDKALSIFGYINKSVVVNSKARKKRLRDSVGHIVNNNVLGNLLKFLQQKQTEDETKLQEVAENCMHDKLDELKMYEIIGKYVTEGNKETLRCIFHDFRHYASEIIQNLNLFILETQKGDSFEKQVDNSHYNIQSAFHSAKLMTSSLDSYAYTENPSTLLSSKEISKFRLHSLLLKILRIYKASFDEKEIKTSITGENLLDIISNEKAVPVLMLSLIDNARKYAPRGTRVNIHFQDTENAVRMRVTSEGPLIEDDEKRKIFTIYYRGKHIPRGECDGSGFGLYSLSIIARKLGIEYSVRQSKGHSLGFYETEFSLEFPAVLIY
jgi:signal transduction histidine kinase